MTITGTGNNEGGDARDEDTPEKRKQIGVSDIFFSLD
jgi:hypothetical protein